MRGVGLSQIIWRTGLRVAYLIIVSYWFVCRPHTSGVQVAVLQGDRVLLLRHGYMHFDKWGLPGGSKKNGEDVLAAAKRELLEETGLRIKKILEKKEIELFHDYHFDLVSCFVVQVKSEKPTVDGIEIVEAKWFNLDKLPPMTAIAERCLNGVRRQSSQDAE